MTTRRLLYGGAVATAALSLATLLMATVPAVPVAAAGGLAVDRSVVYEAPNPGNVTSMTTPAFTTSSSDELVLVGVMLDDIGGQLQSVTAVTGGGLSFSRVAQENGSDGDAEIWSAWSPGILTNASVTATFTSKKAGLLTVTTFTGAEASVGAKAINTGSSGAATVSLTTTAAGSWVWMTGDDFTDAESHTAGSGQTIATQYGPNYPSFVDDFWLQHTDTTIAGADSVVSMNDPSPTGSAFNVAAVEILAAPPPTPAPTPVPTASPTPAPTATGSASATSSAEHTAAVTASATPSATPSSHASASAEAAPTAPPAGAAATPGGTPPPHPATGTSAGGPSSTGSNGGAAKIPPAGLASWLRSISHAPLVLRISLGFVVVVGVAFGAFVVLAGRRRHEVGSALDFDAAPSPAAGRPPS